MAQTKSPTALQYLDKAMSSLRDIGLVPEAAGEPAPIVALLNQISDLDPDRVAAIARTLDQMSHFNDIVREHISGITVGERYEGITTAFNSIRDDSKGMVKQYADGKISTMERVSNVWMKMTRGDIASRFGKIKELYLQVQKETDNQIKKERQILEAYLDFRGALKQSEVLALEVLEKAAIKLDDAKTAVAEAMKTIEAYTGKEASERAGPRTEAR